MKFIRFVKRLPIQLFFVFSLSSLFVIKDGFSQTEILIDFEGEMVDDPIYQRIKDEQSRIIKYYSKVRTSVLNSSLKKKDKRLCLDFISVLYSNPNFYFQNSEVFNSKLPIHKFVDRKILNKDIIRAAQSNKLQEQIQRHYDPNKVKYSVKNKSKIYEENGIQKHLFDKLETDILPQESSVLISGDVHIGSLLDRPNLKYTFQYKNIFTDATFLWENYHLYDTEDAYKHLDIKYFIEKDNTLFGKYDCVIDLDFFTNAKKGALKEKLTSLNNHLNTEGIMIISTSKDVSRKWWESGNTYCGDKRPGYRLTLKKLNKIASLFGLQYLKKIEYKYGDYLIFKKPKKTSLLDQTKEILATE